MQLERRAHDAKRPLATSVTQLAALASTPIMCPSVPGVSALELARGDEPLLMRPVDLAGRMRDEPDLVRVAILLVRSPILRALGCRRDAARCRHVDGRRHQRSTLAVLTRVLR